MKSLMLLATAACGILAAADPAAEKHLVDLAKRSDGASLSRTLTQTFGEKALAESAAHASHGPEFLFAVRSQSKPSLFVDDAPVHGLRPVPESNLWIALTRLETGTSHAFYFLVNGKPLKRTDVRAYTPQHYQQPGVQQGRLSEKFVHTSKIYAGMKSDWWYYTSAGVEPGKPAALMVWQDRPALCDARFPFTPFHGDGESRAPKRDSADGSSADCAGLCRREAHALDRVRHGL